MEKDALDAAILAILGKAEPLPSLTADELLSMVRAGGEVATTDFCQAIWRLVGACKIFRDDFPYSLGVSTHQNFSFGLVQDPCQRCGGLGFVAMPGCMGTSGSRPCPLCPKGLERFNAGW